LKIGYVRVSRIDQNENRQLDELNKYGCEKIYIDKASGIRQDRPEFRFMIDHGVRSDDIIVATELSRLGRSLLDLIKVLDELKDKNVHIITLKEGINTSTSMGKAMFQVAGVFAEMEREYIIERTRSGLEAARARGRQGGKPKLLDEAQVQSLLKLSKDSDFSPKDIQGMFKIKKATYYKYLKDNREKIKS
jgi:DNA invertase Pin-like site-specific DNA recombinase